MHGTDTFDIDARDRIRQKLLRYMQAHRIGVPRLAERISQALPRKPEIPVKTLQRFLARCRTIDRYVGFFDAFAATLQDADPVGELGRAMAALYDTAEPKGPVPKIDLSGPFVVSYGSDEEAGIIEFTREGTFWRLCENISAEGRLIYDGVMVRAPGFFLVMLRDRLMGWPKSYFLLPARAGFMGRGMATTAYAPRDIPLLMLTRRSDG